VRSVNYGELNFHVRRADWHFENEGHCFRSRFRSRIIASIALIRCSAGGDYAVGPNRFRDTLWVQRISSSASLLVGRLSCSNVRMAHVI